MSRRGDTRAALVAAALVLLAAATGCKAHVALRASGPAAPLASRLSDYRNLRPVTQVRQPYLYVISAVERNFLLLADGRRIHHPEDLLTVVGPCSATARYVARIQRLKKAQFWISTVGTVIGLAGAVMAIVGFTGDNTDLGIAGSVAGGVGFMGGYNLGRLFDAMARDTSLSAFTSYDRSLRDFLRICKVDGKVGACAGAP